MPVTQQSAHVSDPTLAMQHADVHNELESDEDLHGHQVEDDDGQLMEFDHSGGGPDGAGHEGEDPELRNVGSVNDVNAELGLHALRDSPDGVKPFYPYSTLISKWTSRRRANHLGPSLSFIQRLILV